MPPTKHILVIGIAVVDAIARPVDVFPAPGGLRFFEDLTLTTGGCAVNCAIALRKMGLAPVVIARVGRDPLGDFVVAELHRNAVETKCIIRDDARPTSFSFVAVPSSGERAFLHTTGANASLRPDDIPAWTLRSASHVFVTGATLMDALDGAPTAGLLSDARAAGAATLMDTVYVEGLPTSRWRDVVDPCLPQLDYFVPSELEARAITGMDDPHAAARELQKRGARQVVIKLGARGVVCLDAAGSMVDVPAFRAEHVVDATGAGDCWSAGFLAGLSEGRSMLEAARMGNAVACASVGAAGATSGITGRPQIQAIMGHAGPVSRK